MQNRNRCFKYILSFFLVLAAFLIIDQHQSIAYAADRIYYFNMDDNGLEGSMMLVESNGSWGLVDAGHRKATTIKDSNGATYATNVNGLSSQVYCRNGKDVANYMINNLGVKHLDFIVGTHAHSDHIGGIPEIAATSFKDSSGKTRYLVDSNTTYYYKEYQHISDVEDDLARYSSNSWHNQAFAYQAKTAMANQGAELVDVSKAQVIHGDPGNAYGDYVTFNIGNMSFRLYNIYEQTNTGNENVNSIVTVMTNGNYTVVNLADINTNNGAIDKTSQAIAKDFGDVDVVVAGHHGYAGSNTKSMFDSLQPSFVVVPNGQESSWLYTDCDLAAAIPYAQGVFGTLFYNLSISQYAVVTDLSGRQVYVYSVNGKGDLSNAINKMMKKSNKTGWVSWVQSNGTLWSYLENGNSIKNTWKQDDGKWYFFDKTGIMHVGWLKESGKTYYLYKSEGYAARGWENLSGKWYYFDPGSCAMQTGWLKDGGKWYFLGSDGAMQTGWLKQGGKTYYLYKSEGYAARGWENLGGKWYHFDDKNCWLDTPSGWQKINGGWYYFDSNGVMQTGWLKHDGNMYYLYKSEGYAARGWENLGGKKYYFDPGSCAMQTGWKEISGGWYYFDGNGVMQEGWQKYEGNTYYLYYSEGYAARGWENLGGKWYHFDDKNCWLDTPSGWQKINGGWYYFDSNGVMQTGWLKDNGKTYYLYKSEGYAACGWENLGGKKYYFDPGSCAMQIGWKEISGGWYYFDGNGVMQEGWLEDNGKTYYLYKNEGYAARGFENLGGNSYYFDPDSCAMQTGWKEISGGWYYFDGSGVMQTGWLKEGGSTYYLYAGEGYAARGWENLSGNWYYFDQKTCAMQTGWQEIDGKWYYLDPNDGHMLQDTTVDGYYINADGVWAS